MAKLKCHCGNVLSNVGWPSPNLGDLITQSVQENCDSHTQDVFAMKSIDVWECPLCKRIAMFLPNKPDAHWYEPMNKQQDSLLDKVV